MIILNYVSIFSNILIIYNNNNINLLRKYLLILINVIISIKKTNFNVVAH